MSASYFRKQPMMQLDKEHTGNVNTRDLFSGVKKASKDKEEKAYLVEEEEDEEPVDNTQD
jgi:hypothetical protein